MRMRRDDQLLQWLRERSQKNREINELVYGSNVKRVGDRIIPIPREVEEDLEAGIIIYDAECIDDMLAEYSRAKRENFLPMSYILWVRENDFQKSMREWSEEEIRTYFWHTRFSNEILPTYNRAIVHIPNVGASLVDRIIKQPHYSIALVELSDYTGTFQVACPFEHIPRMGQDEYFSEMLQKVDGVKRFSALVKPLDERFRMEGKVRGKRGLLLALGDASGGSTLYENAPVHQETSFV